MQIYGYVVSRNPKYYRALVFYVESPRGLRVLNGAELDAVQKGLSCNLRLGDSLCRITRVWLIALMTT